MSGQQVLAAIDALTQHPMCIKHPHIASQIQTYRRTLERSVHNRHKVMYICRRVKSLRGMLLKADVRAASHVRDVVNELFGESQDSVVNVSSDESVAEVCAESDEMIALCDGVEWSQRVFDDVEDDVRDLCDGIEWSDEEREDMVKDLCDGVNFDEEFEEPAAVECDKSFVCVICRMSFVREEMLAAHSLVHMQSEEQYVVGHDRLVRSAVCMNGLSRDYLLSSADEVLNIPEWMREQVCLLRACLMPLMRTYVVKAGIVVHVRLVQVDPLTGHVVKERVAPIPGGVMEHVMLLCEWWSKCVCRFTRNLEKYLNVDGSDWLLDGLDRVVVKVSLLENAAGRGVFELPASLKRKQAVVNVNCERACFKYAVLSVLHYADLRMQYRGRVSKYAAWEDELKFDGLNVDEMSVRDVAKFERMNGIKVNVHYWDGKYAGVIYNNRHNTSKKTVNLLLIKDKDGQHHYCGVPQISRLMRHTKLSNNQYSHICDRCMKYFQTKESYTTHYQYCSQGKAQVEEMPREKEFGYVVSGNELSPLHVVYADAECFINEEKAHMPGAIGMYDVWHVGHEEKNEYKSWVGEECVVDFLRELERKVKDQYHNDQLTRQKMIITPQEHTDFYKSTACPKCKQAYTDKNIKVRDHDHVTGRFRGALCNKCNIKLRQKRDILPVIFHNLKNYDMHLILKHGIDHFKTWKLTVIAQTSEKYMTLTAKVPVATKTYKDSDKTYTIYYSLKFIDSFQFMSSSLNSLAQNLQSLPHTEKLKQRYPSLSTDVLHRKGVFPYSYFSSLNVLRETSLPPRTEFKNDLTGEECKEEDYTHAHRAWREFGCKTFKDFMLRYLELDVMLLADVFEEFRCMSLREDGLEPVHFVSLPGLTFQSAFKMTGETIHLLQDPHMYNIFERGIRGGLTFVNTHHAREQLVQVGDKEMKQIILYIDQNNLYGAAMSEFLPHSNFQFLSDTDIQTRFPDETHILNLDTEGDVGYLFEVDLHYPPHIHKQTSDFPLAPESGKVTEQMLSPYMKQLYTTLQQAQNPQRTTQPKFKSTYKLLMTQTDKHNYVIHFKLLKYFINKGIKITKIHNIVQFTQKQFLKPYISFNSRQRAQAQNKFKKDFYKLKNNALFGKTMEDVRKHTHTKLANTKEQHNRLTASPLFYSRDIITEQLEAFHMIKPKVILNKPIYIGQAVLDHSKLAMYTLFYETLPSCPLIHNIKLLGGDTDSFFLALTVEQHITTSDILSDMKQHVDFSNYPTTHPLHSDTNRAKLGCFKDELAGREIEEIIFLRPKMYSIKVKGDSEGQLTIKKAKGIGRGAMRRIDHEQYQQAYHQHREITVNMTILKSVAHTIHTLTFNKRGLSCWDDKRVWLGENESVPHGSVESPVLYVGAERVKPPRCADVWSDDDDDNDDDECNVVGPDVVVRRVTVEGIGSSDVASVSHVVEGEDERGDAVGFDDDDERSENESETEEDRMFIDDDGVMDDDDEPMMRRRRMHDDDDVWDIGALAKRARCG